jgi:hypothetical protein
MADETSSAEESLTDIEMSAINALLGKFNEQVTASDLALEKREFTGVGCYVHFRPELQTALFTQQSAFFAGIGLSCDELSHGIGFMLCVRDGKAVFLEGYTYAGENWPTSFSNARFVAIVDASGPRSNTPLQN